MSAFIYWQLESRLARLASLLCKRRLPVEAHRETLHDHKRIRCGTSEEQQLIGDEVVLEVMLLLLTAHTVYVGKGKP